MEYFTIGDLLTGNGIAAMDDEKFREAPLLSE